jgi:protocatechuate 3,4-dioxygenase beta subunit
MRRRAAAEADGAAYRREAAGAHPPLLHPAYASTIGRAPRHPLVELPHTRSEVTGPRWDDATPGASVADLTRQHAGAPLGERMIVTGQVVDEDDRPVRRTLVEVWQANAAGRYIHPRDQHDAPLDPNFSGVGRLLTDDDGRYRIVTVKPGAYPWRNHPNAWRPAHVHFSIFGPAFATRLVTQMYFPGDPLLPLDPVLGAIPDAAARARLVSSLDLETTVPEWALGYRFDIVLRGRAATPVTG